MSAPENAGPAGLLQGHELVHGLGRQRRGAHQLGRAQPLVLRAGRRRERHQRGRRQPTRVTGVGLDAAAKITFRMESVYMTASSTYAQARTAAISAATDLFGAGSAQVIATTNAWFSVGVGAAYSGGTGGGTTLTYCASQRQQRRLMNTSASGGSWVASTALRVPMPATTMARFCSTSVAAGFEPRPSPTRPASYRARRTLSTSASVRRLEPEWGVHRCRRERWFRAPTRLAVTGYSQRHRCLHGAHHGEEPGHQPGCAS